MSSQRLTAADLRSQQWFAPDDRRSFGHRSRLRQMGYTAEEAEGRPVIAIVNTGSDLAKCHTHFPQPVQAVKRGVWQADGFSVEIPVISLPHMVMNPTAMLDRNRLTLEAEEVLRCHPVDGGVLMGGSAKTLPGLLIGGDLGRTARHLHARMTDARPPRGRPTASCSSTPGPGPRSLLQPARSWPSSVPAERGGFSVTRQPGSGGDGSPTSATG